MIGAGDNDQVTMTYGFWGATNNHCDMSPECYILHLGTQADSEALANQNSAQKLDLDRYFES